MQLAISVKPYTRKFLERHLGANYKLSRVDLYGRYLFSLLRHPRSDGQYDASMKQYTAQFTVSIEPALVFDRGLTTGCRDFTSCMTNDFNDLVEKVFKQEFHSWVAVNKALGRPVYLAIRDFVALHRLTEEDISLETLTTSYKRYVRKEMKRQGQTAINPSALNQAA